MSTQSGVQSQQLVKALRLSSAPRGEQGRPAHDRRPTCVARQRQILAELVGAADRVVDEQLECCAAVACSGRKSSMSSRLASAVCISAIRFAGLRHVALVGNLLVALATAAGRRQQPLLVDEAVEIGRRNGPRIALVLDELVHARDRRTVAVMHELDGADQRRGVVEAGDAGRGSCRSRSRDRRRLRACAAGAHDVAVVDMQRRAQMVRSRSSAPRIPS